MKKVWPVIKAFGESVGWVIALLTFCGAATGGALVTGVTGLWPPMTAFIAAHQFMVGLVGGGVIAGAAVGAVWASVNRFGKAKRELKAKQAAKDRSAVINGGDLFVNSVEGIMMHVDPEHEDRWSRFHETTVVAKLAEAAGLEGVLRRMGIRMHMEPRPSGRLYQLDLFKDRLQQIIPLLEHNLQEDIQRKTLEFEADAKHRVQYAPDGEQKILLNYK